jgi:hypothetical protein
VSAAWTPEATRAFARHVLEPHATVIRPGDPGREVAVLLVRALAGLLPGVARAALSPLLDAVDEHAGRVSVTLPTPLGTVVVLSPAAVADPVTEACTLLHERVHADQVRDAGGTVQAASDYLGSGELRAQREADAAAGGAWLRYVLTGALPAGAKLSPIYHLSDDEQNLALDLRASHAATIAAGLVPPLRACVDAARWLAASPLVPDDVRARVPKVPA